MLATGAQKLERMRDGRAVYIGAERIDDVTTHPAFRAGAHTIAALYDLRAAPVMQYDGALGAGLARGSAAAGGSSGGSPGGGQPPTGAAPTDGASTPPGGPTATGAGGASANPGTTAAQQTAATPGATTGPLAGAALATAHAARGVANAIPNTTGERQSS